MFDVATLPNGMFCGTVFGLGVVVSDDGGRTWRESSAGLSTADLNRIVVSNGVTYVVESSGWSLFRSVDGAQTWTSLHPPGVKPVVNAITADGNGAVYVGTQFGLFRSVDMGDSWKRVDVGLEDTSIFSVSVLPTGTILVEAAPGQNYIPSDMYRSTNGGVGWTHVATLDNSAVHKMRSVEGSLYICTLYGLLRSDDDAKTWTRIGIDAENVWDFVQTAAGNLLAGTDNGIYVSTNRGASWSQHIDAVTRSRVRAFARGIDGTLVAALDSAVAVSRDEGSTWTLTGEGLAQRLVRRLAECNGTLYAATTSGLLSSVDDGEFWSYCSGPGASNGIAAIPAGVVVSSGSAYVQHANSTTWTSVTAAGYHAYCVLGTSWGEAFIGTQGMQPILRSTSLDTWTSCDSFPVAELIGGLSESASGTLYATSSRGLYRSTDRGTSWTVCGPRALAVAASPDGSVFACSRDSGWSSPDGAVWTSMVAPFAWNDLQAWHCDSEGRLYAASTHHLFKTTDRGITWEAVDAMFPAVVMYDFLVSQGGYLFVAADGGVFRSRERLSP